MIDLILKRYSENISTVDDPAYTDKKVVIGCQRAILLRILSCESLDLTEDERQLVLSSPAYCRNEDYLRRLLGNFTKFLA